MQEQQLQAAKPNNWVKISRYNILLYEIELKGSKKWLYRIIFIIW
jgi:hypothetical protein